MGIFMAFAVVVERDIKRCRFAVIIFPGLFRSIAQSRHNKSFASRPQVSTYVFLSRFGTERPNDCVILPEAEMLDAKLETRRMIWSRNVQFYLRTNAFRV